jgi:SAM-dependent methyltransferase
MRPVRLFLISFLILFLEVALIRWMPAYVRLLSYFSNFILLAAFLGIGVGCLLTRLRSLFPWFAAIQTLVVAAVYLLRLEVAVPSSTSIYFSSGTSEQVIPVESTMLLPLLFIVVAALFATLAQTLGRAMEQGSPLKVYTLNLVGSLAGVGAFALMSWLELPPTAWFGLAFALAVPFVLDLRPWLAAVNLGMLAVSLVLVHMMAAGTIWSPYYKITASTSDSETVVEVNNIFHQSMAPVGHKEYFYQWPYRVFGDTFEDVLILGAGSGTDVAASLLHHSKHIDAVEIDPVIVRLGRERHPDHPYSDPRVRVVTDDARHFLRTTEKKYDLVVFALIDSLTLQSGFASVRLESYMFTEESFRAVRDRLKPNGVLVVYNYFRERWLVDRLANTAAAAFEMEPRVHVHQEHGYLGVMMIGPGLSKVATWPEIPSRVEAYNHPNVLSPGVLLSRDATVNPATDNWPFLYMRYPHVPGHYLAALALVLSVSAAAVWFVFRLSTPFAADTRTAAAVSSPAPSVSTTPGRHAVAVAGGPQAPAVILSSPGHRLDAMAGAPVAGASFPWHFFFLGVGFMLLQTKSIIQFALLWGSTWVVASLTIASVLAMALAATWTVSRIEIRQPWRVGLALLVLLGVSYVLPIGRLAFDSLVLESVVYSILVFSPIFCAGLLFGSSLRRSTTVARDYGANLLGAMVGGVAEYLSLATGFQFLLLVIAACYVLALVTRRERQ